MRLAQPLDFPLLAKRNSVHGSADHLLLRAQKPRLSKSFRHRLADINRDAMCFQLAAAAAVLSIGMKPQYVIGNRVF
tara:strand:- start:317 stop:547 length:231 start_codon:yes stop_codon:yes gene_type:complete